MNAEISTPLTLKLVVRILDLLSIDRNVMVLGHVAHLELSLDLELNRFDDGVLLVLLQILVFADGHQVRLELLELVLNLILNIIEVEWTTASRVFSNL